MVRLSFALMSLAADLGLELMEAQTLSYPIYVRIMQKPRLLKPGDLTVSADYCSL